MQRRNIAGWNGQRVGARLGLEIREADGQHDGPKGVKPLAMQTIDQILREHVELMKERVAFESIRFERLLFADRLRF